MKRILLIDDEKDTRTLLASRLKSFGFDVVIAADAIAGYEAAKSKTIDLILLDLSLPEVSGAELNEVLDLFLKDKKVVVCSSCPVDEQKRIIPNATDYFDKAEGPDVLRKKVENALGPESS